MSTKTITVCTVCNKESCDGKEYTISYGIPYSGGTAERNLCTSQTILEDNGERAYYVIFGHGMVDRVVAVPKEEE